MELLESKTVETVAIVVLCLSATLGVIVAVLKGRRIAWCIPCTLFPPLIVLLIVLPATRRAGMIRCPSCGFWNPVRRDTCARCRWDLDDSTAVE